MKKLFMYEALKEAIEEEMSTNKKVCLLGEDIGHYGGSYKVTKNLVFKYGDLRVLDTPIAENSFVGLAVGASLSGLRPIVEGMNISFLLLAFNQISNNLGMLRYTSGGNFKLPVVLRGPGGVGRQLGAEHSQRLESYLQAVPGLKIVACSTPYNAKGLLKSAIKDNNPILFFEHVLLYNIQQFIPRQEYYLPLSKAELVKEGRHVTVITYSRMRYHVLQAILQLGHSYSVEVIDLLCLKPIDIQSIGNSLKKTHKLILVEECLQAGGISSEIIAQVNDKYFYYLDRKIVRLSSLNIPTPYNKTLEDLTIVSVKAIMSAIKGMTTDESL
uniref:Pyruvate dehydrogenase E1 component subunit beta n=1 Tax=Pterocladiophila hemisphaerica TaxID=2712948 RepID=A0A6M3WXM3_9FLOR|nr:odpB [Pterocladiophila hemisphaerica]